MYKLIIVDDEEKIAEGIATLFPWEQIGYEVAGYFHSGTEALEFVRHNPVDVVLSDIEMPDINGLELCRALKETENVKVIFFSSHQSYEYFRGAIQYQASDYLLKPIRYNELISCMEKVTRELDEGKGSNDQAQFTEEEEQTYYGKIVATVQEYLETHFKDASLEEVAELVGLSPSYLSRTFKQKSGASFSEYLLGVRMKKACEMLRDIHYKSYDIAYYVGYDNPKNFSRAFKAYYNITPNEYRNHMVKRDESL